MIFQREEEEQLTRRVMDACVGRPDLPASLAVAESCTGGMLAAWLSALPGASRFFRGGVVAYDNEVKTSLLRVPAAVLMEHGAVSAQTAAIMAEKTRELFHVDISVAVSGIAGPAGGGPGKPVGLVYIADCGFLGVRVQRFVFEGDRHTVRRESCMKALALIEEQARKYQEKR